MLIHYTHLFQLIDSKKLHFEKTQEKFSQWIFTHEICSYTRNTSIHFGISTKTGESWLISIQKFDRGQIGYIDIAC